jgi:hypothetical protein
MPKSMLNAEEREEYVIGSIVRAGAKAAKPKRKYKARRSREQIDADNAKILEQKKAKKEAKEEAKLKQEKSRGIWRFKGSFFDGAEKEYLLKKEEPEGTGAFRAAWRNAWQNKKNTFMHKGDEYSTDLSMGNTQETLLVSPKREGKEMGGEMESFETTQTRRAAIEKDEKERKERMLKAEAKRLGVSEERLKEILLEREQEEMDRKMQEAAGRFEKTPMAEGSLMMPVEGMPVDTYPNIPADEMDEALASQLPDDEMEDDYIKYVMDESLSDEEQDYLADALQNDSRLEDILEKVMLTATEFSGAGEVDGPGTGVSDSIPARLSDGEFVFTKKATDQIGADALQRMMDDAERAYDGGYQMKAVGGMMEDEDPENLGMSQTQEEIEKLMMGANRMPSLQ